MKKTYIAPEAAIECHFAEVMQLPLNSVQMQGQGKDESGNNIGDATWNSGGEGQNGDWVDAKASSIWDDWAEESEEE